MLQRLDAMSTFRRCATCGFLTAEKMLIQV